MPPEAPTADDDEDNEAADEDEAEPESMRDTSFDSSARSLAVSSAESTNVFNQRERERGTKA
jgi:hypothetical protein